MNNDRLLFMFVQIAEKIPLFRHTIIGHAHIKPDIILSLIHLAQEGKVSSLPSRCPSYLFFLGNEGLQSDDDRRLSFANIRVVSGRHTFTAGGHQR